MFFIHSIYKISEAISDVISGVFKISVVAQELAEPITGISAKVIVDEVNTSQFNSAYYERTVTFAIVYYAKNANARYKEECLDIMQAFESYFLQYGIAVEDDNLAVRNCTFKIGDNGTAAIQFDIYENSTELYDISKWYTDDDVGSKDNMYELEPDIENEGDLI